MANFIKVIKGWIIKNDTDQTKELQIEVSDSAATETKTTIQVSQSDNRIISLPDATDTLIGRETTDQDVNRLRNKDLDDSSILFVDNSDTSKKLQFELSSITTGNTRTMTIPDVNTTLVGTDNSTLLQNKKLEDNTTTIVDNTDNSKAIKFEVSGITTATTRTITPPNADFTIVGEDVAQDITNKTLLEVDNLQINGNNINSLNTDGNITLDPNGNGNVQLTVAGTGVVQVGSSNVTTNSSGNVDINGDLDVDNINIDANSIISTNTDGNITLDPNGNGNVQLTVAGTGVVQVGSSNITANPSGVLNVTGSVNVDNLTLDGNTLSSSDTNGNVILDPNGTGSIRLVADNTEAEGPVSLEQAVDSTTTGADQDVAKPTKSYVKFTNASLTSIRSFGAGFDGQFFVLTNDTGSAITLKNEDVAATAANRILTGTGLALTLNADQSAKLIYDSNESRWRVVGGFGSASSTSINARYKKSATQSIAASGVTVNFETQDYDDNSTVTTGASWVFTAPENGVYLVTAQVAFFETENWTAGNDVSMRIFKNGSSYSTIYAFRIRTSVTGDRLLVMTGSDSVKLTATDTISINALHQESTNRTISVVGSQISITKTGT